MTVYTVYEPPGGDDADTQARADKIAFVKEGFNWVALIVPALWLIFQRMWLELIVFLVIIGVIPLFFGTGQAERELAGWLTLAVTVVFAFEANDLRGWALQRRGYRFSGVASGRDRIEAERSFFTAWLPQQDRRVRVPEQQGEAKPAPARLPARRADNDEVIGSFPRA